MWEYLWSCASVTHGGRTIRGDLASPAAAIEAYQGFRAAL
jgi:hypothetical protein